MPREAAGAGDPQWVSLLLAAQTCSPAAQGGRGLTTKSSADGRITGEGNQAQRNRDEASGRFHRPSVAATAYFLSPSFSSWLIFSLHSLLPSRKGGGGRAGLACSNESALPGSEIARRGPELGSWPPERRRSRSFSGVAGCLAFCLTYAWYWSTN